jgi:hypothetical protein
MGWRGVERRGAERREVGGGEELVLRFVQMLVVLSSC